ncbi:hypothetical protein [Mycoplasma seminis]|uniref:Lipoprotein n=1 Tax=Mycoplasma seminis TaxID=512749 RepID=A0ABY9HCA1_9MOLU|nr:hypothetical protein [Mycoplasma seminis]WLP85815.1 hypothetical protein Q8852_01565 [Mycoplasma seminis]
MKKLYKNMFIALGSISALALPLTAISCSEKSKQTKENQNNLYKSVAALQDLGLKYVKNIADYYEKIILSTKNGVLKETADLTYAELSAGSTQKYEDDFFRFYNNIKDIKSLTPYITNKYYAVMSKITKGDISNPINYVQAINNSPKDIVDLFQNLGSTYFKILETYKKSNSDEGEKLLNEFAKINKVWENELKVYLFAVFYLQKEIKVFGMNDMTINLLHSKYVNDKNEAIARDIVNSTNEWNDKYINLINSFTFEQFKDTEKIFDTIKAYLKAMYDEFYSKISDKFYSIQASVLQARQSSDEFINAKKQYPIKYVFSDPSNPENNNKTNVFTTIQELKEKYKDNKKAIDSINALKKAYFENGVSLESPTLKNDFADTGESKIINLAYNTPNGISDTFSTWGKVYTRNSKTNQFDKNNDVSSTLVDTFNNSDAQYVIQVDPSDDFLNKIQVIYQVKTDFLKDFYNNTKHLVFNLNPTQTVNSRFIGENILFLNSYHNGLIDNYMEIGQWDKFIFFPQQAAIINSQQAIKGSIFIGLNQETYSKLFPTQNTSNSAELLKQKQKLESELVPLADSYFNVVKKFLIPLYDAKNNSNQSKEQYYEEQLSKIVTVKDNKNYITRSKLADALNNYKIFIESCPTLTNEQKQQEITKTQEQIEKTNKTLNDQITAANSEISKLQEKLKVEKDQAKIKELQDKIKAQEDNVTKTQQQLKDFDTLAKEEIQKINTKETKEEWLQKLNDFNIVFNLDSKDKILKTINETIDALTKPINEINKQLEDLNNSSNTDKKKIVIILM